ncbi:hypothetical protein EVAR_12909_1 [Eumeta japonica]|uniref:Uncharacterized protein n=1 Tax=Eumeta variegata TaxID=151549 RepID=A0A4C1TW37_EUMVA|nr:hypothetical protein EVAR_12909_1 [Eumeta japonica]
MKPLKETLCPLTLRGRFDGLFMFSHWFLGVRSAACRHNSFPEDVFSPSARIVTARPKSANRTRLRNSDNSELLALYDRAFISPLEPRPVRKGQH